MLQSIRQLAHSWVVKGLMLMLMVSFSIWGIGDIFRGNPLQQRVAKVGEREIVVQQLNQLFSRLLTQARQTTDPNLTAERAKQMGLLDRALDTEVHRLLIEQEIKRLDIEVSRDSVLAVVAQEPQLRNKDGSFNKDKFRQILQQQGLTENAFVTQGQQDIARQTLQIGLSASPAPSQTLIDALYKAQAQKRVLDVVTIDTDKITGIAAPDDKTLQAYYDKHSQLFTAPEYRAVTVASLSATAMEKDITITDDQVKKEYETNIARYAHAELRDVIQIVTQDQARAQQLSIQARASGDLAATAKANKETIVPLDRLEEKNLIPELAKPIFTLAAGEVSTPVKSQLGWHILQIKKILPPGKADFDKIKDKLHEDMRRDQAVEAATRIVNQVDDELAAGHSLDDIADSLHLRLVKLPAIDAKGLTPEGKAPTELPFKDIVLKSAFGQGAGETSPIEDDKEGNYIIVRTDEVSPAAAKPYDKVKAAVLNAWKEQEQFAKATTEAEKLTAALREGKPAAALATNPWVTARQSAPISQLGDKDASLPPSLAAAALPLGKGQTASMAVDGKQYIVRVAQIIEPENAKTDTRRNLISGRVKQAANGEILDQYLKHLYEVFPVKINQAAVEKLRGQQEQEPQ